MPRMRTLKPGFFKNEDLAELDPLACLLFAGLWCWADREGRLEDRPKRLKLEILPARECDADQLLAQLAERGFIVRYEDAAGGRRLIQIVAFLRHQNPHAKEPASVLPPPPDEPGACTGHAPGLHRAGPADHGSPTMGSRPSDPGEIVSAPGPAGEVPASCAPTAGDEEADEPDRLPDFELFAHETAQQLGEVRARPAYWADLTAIWRGSHLEIPEFLDRAARARRLTHTRRRQVGDRRAYFAATLTKFVRED